MRKVNLLTNANFTKDASFKLRCEVAGVQPTKRQASKYRSGKGRAYRVTLKQLNDYAIKKQWKDE